MLKMDRLAMASRLQFFVQPPDVHAVEQADVVHGVVQAVVVHSLVHDLVEELWGLLQNPSLQSVQVSLYRQLLVSGVLHEECA
jgi:hypothetical protein